MRQKIQHFDIRQHMKGTTYEIFHYNEPMKREVEVHNHGFYEIFFLLKGNISYWMEGEIYHPGEGDMILIDPMTLHRPLISAEEPAYERIVMWIEKSYLDSFSVDGVSLSGCFGRKSSCLLHPNSSQRAELTEKFGNLVREYYSDEYGATLYADGLFRQIMVELNRMGMKSERPQTTRGTSTLVSKVVEYIGEHFSEDLSLDNLAERFFVSKYHLSHEFSNNVGTSVYRYITLKRLTMAKNMLMDGDASGTVCMKCGFKDYTAFFRAFKAEYGIGPREFLREIQKNV